MVEENGIRPTTQDYLKLKTEHEAILEKDRKEIDNINAFLSHIGPKHHQHEALAAAAKEATATYERHCGQFSEAERLVAQKLLGQDTPTRLDAESPTPTVDTVKPKDWLRDKWSAEEQKVPTQRRTMYQFITDVWDDYLEIEKAYDKAMHKTRDEDTFNDPANIRGRMKGHLTRKSQKSLNSS
jgi:hypothetical protein